MNIKRISIIFTLILGAVSFLTNAAAFYVEEPLENQLTDLENTGLMLTQDGGISLEKTEDNIETVLLSPDYENDELIYAATDTKLYQNDTFDADFYQSDKLPEAIQNKEVKVIFGSDYDDYGALLIYTGKPKDYDITSAQISYDNGNTWSEQILDTQEPISEIAPGPDFANTERIYFITNSGLYSQEADSDTSDLVLSNEGEDFELRDIRFPSTNANEEIFYMVRGSTVLKTEDLGYNWLEYDAGEGISKILVQGNGTESGDVLILSGLKNLEKSDDGLDYYDLNLPGGISEIYDFTYVIGRSQDYLITTDQGVYITYNDGYNWTKLNYDITDYNKIYNLNAADINGRTTIFFVYENVLYRDLDAEGDMEEYMNGIETTPYYMGAGMAESVDIVDLSGEDFDPGYNVNQATLWADGEANGQTMNFYMSADGVTWEQVTPNEPYEFLNQGNTLKWRVEIATDDPSVSPVLNSVMIDFGFDEIPDETCAGFTDIMKDDPACDVISYVKDEGIFEGYPDGSFKPDQAINRAETVKVIVEGFDYSILVDDGTNLSFSDVIIGEWYMTYLKTAKEEGIIEGYPDGTFKPEQTVNYVEMIKIFFESANVALEDNLPGQEWYQKYVDYAEDNGYNLYEDFAAGMNRIDVAELFYHLNQL